MQCDVTAADRSQLSDGAAPAARRRSVENNFCQKVFLQSFQVNLCASAGELQCSPHGHEWGQGMYKKILSVLCIIKLKVGFEGASKQEPGVWIQQPLRPW